MNKPLLLATFAFFCQSPVFCMKKIVRVEPTKNAKGEIFVPDCLCCGFVWPLRKLDKNEPPYTFAKKTPFLLCCGIPVIQLLHPLETELRKLWRKNLYKKISIQVGKHIKTN